MSVVLEEFTGLFGRGLWFKDKPNVSTAPLAAIISGIQRIRDLLNVGCYRQAHSTRYLLQIKARQLFIWRLVIRLKLINYHH